MAGATPIPARPRWDSARRSATSARESFDARSGDLLEHGCAWGDPSWRWLTWSGGRPSGEAGYQGGGLVMVGEKGYPLEGHTFLLYSGRWGEIGELDETSGPRGPAYQDKWNAGRASSGGGGGGGCEALSALEPCIEPE